MAEVPNIVLLWTDIETTGLDYESDFILEIAWQFTDYLGVPLSGLTSQIAIEYNDEELMPKVLERYRRAAPYVKKMHLDNDLWSDVFFAENVDRADFYRTMETLYAQIDDQRTNDVEIRLAGSSVHFDKRFLETVYGEELPISHRVHDLSTFRPFFKWQDLDLNEFTTDLQTDNHRAAADVERDIAQWRGLIEIITAKE